MRRLQVLLLAVLACALVAIPAAQAARVKTKAVAQDKTAVQRYWTAERMRNAIPADKVLSGTFAAKPKKPKTPKRDEAREERISMEIVVDAYDDPKVQGVACYVSRAKTGGIKGAIGIAEDKAEASIACRQVGPITVKQPLPHQEEVFNERISLVFKKLRIVRLVDPARNTLVYLTYSDRLIDGSPQNSITAHTVTAKTKRA